MKEQNRPEDSRENLQKEIIRAIEDFDITGLIKAGWDSFISVFRLPVSFDSFLKYTDSIFDEFVLDTERDERLSFIGGKFLMQYSNLETITLKADFYFQNSRKQWVVKKKTGQIPCERFSDWEDSADLIELRESGKLEFPIDPPKRDS